MFYVIIGVIVAIISLIIFRDVLEVAIPGAIVLALLAFSGTLVITSSYLESTQSYNTLPAEAYALKEIQDNRYYERSTSGDSVSIYVIQPDGSYVKETYEEDKVVFLDGDKAQVSIVKEEADWSKSVITWFFYVPEEKERIQSVTITVPTDSYEENEVVQNMVSDVESADKEITEISKFCTGCGTEVKEEWVFCSSCGKKIGE